MPLLGECDLMKKTQAVGIDLGTTYSCIAWLNEHGHPNTIPNQEGELSTPSVVFFDDDGPVVGTEALRNAISRPSRVVQNAKRFMGHSAKSWEIDGRRYTPVYISGLILRKLIAAAQDQIGEITDAVITVPAQFSDTQRSETIKAGLAAGLERVEVINEPVAAALCHVLGNEGLAFTELAVDQQLLIYDLGGGTLDLAIVKYASNEVRVVASDGDLELGGLDWTQVVVDIAAEKFIEDFRDDPRTDPESHQFLALEAEQAKRSLSVRPRAAVTVQHAGNRRTYQIEQDEFEAMSKRLLTRSDAITRRILADKKFGWAHIDVVLTTGGASRMPMVRESLKKLSGRTLNSSLSPDQSIAHGAAYYAGMLLTNQNYTRTIFDSRASARLQVVKQQSVSARSLGILVRDSESEHRVPHYLIPPNTPLPASKTHVFGTVVDRQTKVHVRIVESGAGPGKSPTFLGDCLITDLPPDLPEGSEVEVTISYDRQARVHVSAKELKSGLGAEVEIIRHENLAPQLQFGSQELPIQQPARRKPPETKSELLASAPPPKSESKTRGKSRDVTTVTGRQDEPESIDRSLSEEWAIVSEKLESLSVIEYHADVQPIRLCNRCAEPVDRNGICPACRKAGVRQTPSANRSSERKSKSAGLRVSGKTAPPPLPKSNHDDDLWEIVE